MSTCEQLLSLQWRQLRHDETYHKDVLILSLAERIKHMALHYAKYSARFFEFAEVNDKPRFISTLTDAFIISLASANTLNQDLGRSIGDRAKTAESLLLLGAELTKELGRPRSDPIWLGRTLVQQNGRLAKCCESWDHLESVSFRDVMLNCNLEIFKAILVEARALGVDLSETYGTRLRSVEERSIFYHHYQKCSKGAD
ncbi:MAG: hypothetical protein SGJ20_12785 [Planctomycetota bacterium]|nr:hypothetical protein [Planctomycetota bacterium]